MNRILIHAIFCIALLLPGAALAVTSGPNAIESAAFYVGDYTGTVSINGRTPASYDLTIGLDCLATTIGESAAYLFIPELYGDRTFNGDFDKIAGAITSVRLHTSLDTITYTFASVGGASFAGTALFSAWNGSEYLKMVLSGSGIDMDGQAFTLTASFARATPIPAAVWLLGTGLAGLVGVRRRMSRA